MLRQHWLEAYRCGLREFVLRPKGLPLRRRFIDSYNLLSWLRLDKLLILCFPEFSVCWVSLHMIQFVTSIGQYGYYKIVMSFWIVSVLVAALLLLFGMEYCSFFDFSDNTLVVIIQSMLTLWLIMDITFSM